MARLQPGLGLRLLVRQMRSNVSVFAAIAVTALVTSLLVTGTPRLLETIAGDDLRTAISDAAPDERHLRAELLGRVRTGPRSEPFRFVAEQGESIVEEGLPASVADAIVETRYVIDSPRFRMSSFPDDVEGPFPSFFRFRQQEGIEDLITGIEGSMPRPRDPVPMLIGIGCTGDPLATEDFEPVEDVPCAVVDVPVFEVAITAESARDMMVNIGDDLLLKPDALDSVWSRVPPPDHPLIMSISGILELTDASDEAWFADDALHRPRIMENPDFRWVFPVGILAPDQYGPLLRSIPPVDFNYTWRYYLDHDVITAQNAEAFAKELGTFTPPDRVQLRTRLQPIVQTFVEQRALTQTLLSVGYAGLVALAVIVILVLAMLGASRMGRSTILLRNRGASRPQGTGNTLAHAAIAVVPATAAGAAATAQMWPEATTSVPARVAFLVAVLAVAAVVAAALPLLFRRLGSMQRETHTSVRSQRRLVFEVLLWVIAAAAALQLRRRGMLDAESARTTVDPLIAGAPVVIALGAGLLSLRIADVLMAGAGWLGSRSARVTALVGTRRIASLPPSGRFPAAVVLVAAAVAVLASTVRTSVYEGQETHAAQVVGADYRINTYSRGVPLPRAVAPVDLHPDAVVATAGEIPNTPIIALDRAPRVFVLAVDTDEFAVIAPETESLDAIAAENTSAIERAGRIPVVVSTVWASTGPPPIGTVFRLNLGRSTPEAEVVAIADRFPSVPHGEPFVVLNRTTLRRIDDPTLAPSTVAYLRAPADAADEIGDRLEDMSMLMAIASRYGTLEQLRGDPFARAVDRGFLAITILSVIFAVLATVSSFIISSNRRRRDLAYLRVLGLRAREALSITIIEQLPSVVFGVILGVGVGIGTSRLLAPVIDLEAFTGGVFEARIILQPVALVSIGIVLAAAVIISALVYVGVSGTKRDTQLLRVGDE